MASISPIKGFPEWLPPQRMVEQQLLDRIRRRYELFGYVPVETRAVEPIEYLASKGGDADKEIYVLRRLHADAEDREGAGLGLHFDLTVPFARYVVQNRGRLSFPFRRYQIQKVWRGERPQDGRFREFYQCDADVIAPEKLSLQYDVEIAQLLFEVVSDLPVPTPTIQVNNRKILEGFYRALGLEEITPTLRIVDKLDKIGPAAVRQLLQDQLGMREDASAKVLQLSEISGSGLGVLDQVRALGVQHPLLEEGLSELEFVMRGASDIPDGRLRANLKIARGLDYYTGIVFEGQLDGHEDLGSVCSGGRYENLAAALGSPVKLPGIGVSVGLSRILARMFGKELLAPSRQTPTCVLVALASEEARPVALATAQRLRRRGIPTEVYDRAKKWGEQIKYASNLGIPYVWFPADGSRPDHELRDLRSGEQKAADPEQWMPPDADLHVGILRKGG